MSQTFHLAIIVNRHWYNCFTCDSYQACERRRFSLDLIPLYFIYPYPYLGELSASGLKRLDQIVILLNSNVQSHLHFLVLFAYRRFILRSL